MQVFMTFLFNLKLRKPKGITWHLLLRAFVPKTYQLFWIEIIMHTKRYSKNCIKLFISQFFKLF